MFRWWAFWRRVQYGTGFFVLLTLISVSVYYAYFYTPPSCVDGIMNREERGVDCGGVCARVCTFDAIPLVTSWVESFEVMDGQYNAVAYIQNKNTDIGIQKLIYTFKLYDDRGLITERTGDISVSGIGEYPIFEGRIATGDRIPTRTEIVFDSYEWMKSLNTEGDFSLISRELSGADALPRLTAKIRNADLVNVDDVEIVATIFDSRRNPLTASRTVVENFSGRTTEDIVFTWPQPIATTLRSCEVPTDVVLAIDLSGSMNNDGGVPPEPISSVITAAESFVKRLKDHDQSSLVTYATQAVLVEPLSRETDRIASVVANLTISPKEEQGSTNTGDAIKIMREEMLSDRHDVNARKVAVLLTDGLANAPDENPEVYAQNEAHKLKALGVDVFTIGLGASVNADFLKAIASSPSRYYNALSSEDIDDIYTEITKALCEDGATVIDIIPVPKSNFAPLE